MLLASIASGIICVAFVELFIALNLTGRARDIISCTQKSVAAMASPDLSDREKENAIRKSTLESLKLTLSFAVFFIILCACLYGLYLLLNYTLSLQSEQIIDVMSSLPGIISLTGVALLYTWARNAIKKLRSA